MVSKLFNLWPQISIFLIVFAFFARLFFPPSIFVTPDFGQTDILHIALPQKYELSKSIKNFSLPFWENKAGNGYPFSADTVNTFYLPSLTLLFFLPFELAIPSMYLTIFTITAFGMYAISRHLKFNKLVAIFVAIAFTFSAAMILRVQHVGIIEALSMVPWTFLFFLKLLEKKSLQNIIMVSLFSSEIALSFPQIFLHCVIFFSLIGFLYHIRSKKKVIGFFVWLTVIISFVFMIGAIQFLPTIQLLKQAQRGRGINPASILNQFPYAPKNLLTFVNPYILGTASDGTYKQGGGIYWENVTYIGLIPFAFLVFAFLFQLFKRNEKIFLYFSFSFVFAILLALGQYSPLHILFSFPPLSFFRNPSRFILTGQFFAAILAGFGLTKFTNILNKKYRNPILMVILLSSTLQLFTVWWNYNPIDTYKDWLKKPQLLETIGPHDKIYSIGTMENWNKVFEKSGWKNNSDYFKFFLNGITPDINYFYPLTHFSSYQVISTNRQSLQQSIMPLGIKIFENKISLDQSTKNALNLFSIVYVITTKPIENAGLKLVSTAQKGDFIYYLYKNPLPAKEINIYYDYKTIETLSDFKNALEKLDPQKTVLIEKFSKPLKSGQGEIAIKQSTPEKIQLLATTTEEGIIVFNDSYYSAWVAKIDGNNVPIYPANLNSKAVIVPKGNHTVEFIYQATLNKIGAIITGISLIASVFILLKRRGSKRI